VIDVRTHNAKEQHAMNIATLCTVNKIFSNEHKGTTYVRATLSVADHRGHDVWLTYNVPPAQGDAFKAAHPEGSALKVEGLLYSDNFKGKDGWVNRVGIDVTNIETA
tara:strand:+ start:151 stop:471 length:321 start_codon:yes stop_codon:yes gene_type:complete